MRKILIKRGTLVLPHREVFSDEDVLIEDGRIVRMGKGIQDPQAYNIDASSLLVGPGFINMHVHFREPGEEKKEDLTTGSRAAVKGGFTSVVCMPNTKPSIDNPLVARFVRYRAQEIGLVNVFPCGAITVGCEGKEMTDFGLLKRSGVVALSDDGRSVQSARLLYFAFQYASYFDLPFLLHEEEEEIARGGVMHEGETAFLFGYKGIPEAAEDTMIARDLVLALYTKARLHVTHLSTALGVELLRFFQRFIPVSADVTPHHLLLVDKDVTQFGNLAKVKPPLRSSKDVEALKGGIQEGIIDILASDHAPHAPEDKEGTFAEAAFGISNLEIAVPLYEKALVEEGVLDWLNLWKKLSYNPAKFLGLQDRGVLEEGKIADITIVDPDTEWEVMVEEFESKGKNCPFGGWSLRGWPVYTLVGGKVVMKERKVVDGELC
ncbi:MAG: dihydroorotase [Candidatus Caldatribacteriaceae bacterium]